MGKLDQLRQALKENELDGLLITSSYNRRYVTNFTGTAGVVLITENEAMLITDFRYIEQANDQLTDCKVVEHKQPISLEVADQVKQLGVKKLGFEKDDVTFAVYEQFKKEIEAELVPTSGIVEKLRLIKTKDEINILKEAAKIADAAFDHILTFIKPGVREIDVSNELEFFMRKQGAVSSSFDIIVASGYRSALPHGVASEKIIESGELVTLDFGALYKGYCSDITRTVAVGEISEELHTIYHTVLEAQLKGMEGIKAGITGKEADALTRDHIKEKGYGEYFGHSTGHGLGLEVHEGPGLSFRSNQVLEEGMVVTVEPGIYVPGVGGCRIEDDTVVTKEGNERLNFSPKELIIL
ncbi:Xaa-Pro peptidase family protein [Aquibacillus koreensis]|uniref:Xaa-Pro peptidase family protein n=1 Tax=Aquibacillus koreensis TaxID=279446 RepID=A0A9X4AGI3_9BACI|nr:Xaa-Pro peptidase family protein [Aquibacillus koreensis]MCT2537530.1 Xaa-Pro peptidase family protein [Aquibacillus koreensis]MDC3418976.1 Xaa-Pro peptidase family protein [Aquibacillus koreensis]